MNVLTLVHGRRDHLSNLIRGLESSNELPDALVIVQMNEAQDQWHSRYFPIIHGMVNAENNLLPLAAARNQAVRCAPGNQLIFLDVDCIPAPELTTRYRIALAEQRAVIFQGETAYLPRGAVTPETSAKELTQLGATHPVQHGHQAGDTLPHRLFWSLNFACRRATYQHLGGFDERYQGYGGEDTDFAFQAAAAKVPIQFVPALAFHQFHASFEPPLNHFGSIVANSRLFRERWGIWPMDGWLSQFADAGYISMDRDRITIIRQPSNDDLARCLVNPA